MNADSIRIESDEDGFYLVIETDEDGPRGLPSSQRLRVTEPEQLYDRVKAAIGPWLRERDEARVTLPHYTMPTSGLFACDPDESGGYDVSDPKHPAFHSTHADIWDSREGK